MIWLLVIFWPLLLALWAPPKMGGAATSARFAVAALPALLAAWLQPGVETVGWFLLGAEMGVDGTGRVFLLLAATLWMAAGWFAGPYLRGGERAGAFGALFLATMSGNFGLVVARDVPTFYTFFAVMTFASYGLVVHSRTDRAREAARVYLVMAIVGELFLLSALCLAVNAAGTLKLGALAPALAEDPRGSGIFLLGFIGFGVKAGAIPLHFWLPLAHPAAPAPASAVLSGAMIKAGLLGWMHLAPVGLVQWSSLSSLLVGLGLLAALGAVAVGLAQTDPKTNLAYSSISQMGVMTLLLGIGLQGGVDADKLYPALALYAFNHGIAKGLLFLGTFLPGAVAGRLRGLMWCVLGFAALSIAGGPLTGGSLTKVWVKKFTEDAPSPWDAALPVLLTVSAVGTTLLLSRFLFLLRRIEEPAGADRSVPLAGLLVPWTALGLVCAGWFGLQARLFPLDWFESMGGGGHPVAEIFRPSVLFGAAWPVALGIALFLLALRWSSPLLLQTEPLVPPGDVAVVLLRASRRLGGGALRALDVISSNPVRKMDLETKMYRLLESEDWRRRMRKGDHVLRDWPVAALGYLVFFLALAALLR